jgi:hypothetical protein
VGSGIGVASASEGSSVDVSACPVAPEFEQESRNRENPMETVTNKIFLNTFYPPKLIAAARIVDDLSDEIKATIHFLTNKVMCHMSFYPWNL